VVEHRFGRLGRKVNDPQTANLRAGEPQEDASRRIGVDVSRVVVGQKHRIECALEERPEDLVRHDVFVSLSDDAAVPLNACYSTRIPQSP
jgi:hypothetical protein